MSEDLVTWLRAQLDEDQWHAEELRRSRGAHVEFVTSRGGSTWRCIDPDRLLAEVEAKRRILDEYEEAVRRAATKPGYDAVARLETSLAKVTAPELERVVRLLALPYAGRDGWREEWR